MGGPGKMLDQLLSCFVETMLPGNDTFVKDRLPSEEDPSTWASFDIRDGEPSWLRAPRIEVNSNIGKVKLVPVEGLPERLKMWIAIVRKTLKLDTQTALGMKYAEEAGDEQLADALAKYARLADTKYAVLAGKITAQVPA